MQTKPAFERLIRFLADDGRILYGDVQAGADIEQLAGKRVKLLRGSPQTELTETSEEATVDKILCPLDHVPMFLCIGLNYRAHATEANLPIAPYPVVFTKPPDALAGPFDPIHVHPEAQSKLDYEGELTVIIGRDCKNVSESDALDYVLGYTVGNDVSARNFQARDVSGGQFCYAKSFDQFAPIGPCVVSTAVIPDPQKLSYTTKVNGDLRQKTPTSDMIWTVKQIIAHLSRGTTLRKGTAIMTGTPSGVGLFMKDRDGFVKDGDVVKIEVEQIGGISNRIVFEK